MQRALDRVLGGLVAHHLQGPLDGAAAHGLLEEVEVLAGHQLGAHLVVDGLGAAHRLGREAAAEDDLVGPRQAQVAEQDGRPDAERLRRAEPLGVAVDAGEPAVRRRAARGGCRTRPSRRRGSGRRPAGTPARRRPAGPCRPSPGRRRRRASPSRRRPVAAACRRPAGRSGRPTMGDRSSLTRPRTADWLVRTSSTTSLDSRPEIGHVEGGLRRAWWSRVEPRGKARGRPPRTLCACASPTPWGRSCSSGQRSFSFELFPPKTDEGERMLWQTVREIEALKPTFVSVTYGAGGSTQDRTVRLTGQIAAGHHAHARGAPHLRRRQPRRAPRRRRASTRPSGVTTMLALRGDPPDRPGHAVGAASGRARPRRASSSS